MQAREEMSAGQVHELVLEQLLIRAKVTRLHMFTVRLAQKHLLEHRSSRFGSNHRICVKLVAFSSMSLSFRSCSAPEEMDDREELLTASYRKMHSKP